MLREGNTVTGKPADPKLELARVELEVDTLVDEFHRLTEVNQGLDWDIPSQYQQILDNVERLDAIEARLGQLQVKVRDTEKMQKRAHLRLVK